MAFPDELMVLREERQLAMIENFNSIAGRKTVWHNDKYLKTLGVNLHPQGTSKNKKTTAEQDRPVAAPPQPVSNIPNTISTPPETQAFVKQTGTLLKSSSIIQANSLSPGQDKVERKDPSPSMTDTVNKILYKKPSILTFAPAPKDSKDDK